MPNFFKDEDDLREIWSRPDTRKKLLNRLKESGYSLENFEKIKELINAENSDVFNVLIFLAFSVQSESRVDKVDKHKVLIFDNIESRQKAFIEFVLNQYVKNGVGELDDERIGELINLKDGSPMNAKNELGILQKVRQTFCDFQKYLYKKL